MHFLPCLFQTVVQVLPEINFVNRPSSYLKAQVAQSCPPLCDPMDFTVYGILQARILEWVAFPFFRVFSNPGIEPRSPTLQGDFFYQLRHKGSPRTLEWVAYPFSSGSSWTRNQTGVSCIAGRFFASWATREASIYSDSGNQFII